MNYEVTLRAEQKISHFFFQVVVVEINISVAHFMRRTTVPLNDVRTRI
ncbi:hypothetical protein K08M3_18340 [Vibrio alginolyticus]|uniref:Uncharacterized protein n=1 Tax=Vibrio alginolyticus TaxID=663 RepID=A0A1W6V0M6_VIBAL|nr:hypothetical protein K01M1_18310 [Vibrio alginolyticus]ARP03489.1 hypothetical protein K04M1_18430 [Vibrio alginolyticus]ARP08547.1 hypothetical protein K04M3_18460 [Vibrio alginolyticus]ARP13622.1 hypothetical protein K04M5_18340 [Vibrio alginolyticus]ARP18682.1 hypothetical protein K05K4_18480 [Vibrio alginolyticus]